MPLATHAINELDVPAGLTVGAIRHVCGQALNVHPEAVPFVNDQLVQENQVLKNEDTLSFFKPSGRKGAGRWAKTDLELCKFLKVQPEDLDYLEAQGCKPLRMKDGTRRWTEDAIDHFNGILGAKERGSRGCEFDDFGAATASYLSIKQAARITSLSTTHVRRAIKSGELPASNVGSSAHPIWRIARKELSDWMEKKKGATTPVPPKNELRGLIDRYFGD